MWLEEYESFKKFKKAKCGLKVYYNKEDIKLLAPPVQSCWKLQWSYKTETQIKCSKTLEVQLGSRESCPSHFESLTLCQKAEHGWNLLQSRELVILMNYVQEISIHTHYTYSEGRALDFAHSLMSTALLLLLSLQQFLCRRPCSLLFCAFFLLLLLVIQLWEGGLFPSYLCVFPPTSASWLVGQHTGVDTESAGWNNTA